MQLLGNLDIPKKQNSSGDVQPEYMDFYNSLRMVNDQGPQTIAKLVYTEANEGLLQISQTTRRNFYRPHNQHKFMVSPQRNVNFDAKKGVSELEGLTFPSTSLSAFFFFKRPEVESRQLLDVRRMCGSCRRTSSGVASRLFGSCRRTSSGVASRLCGSCRRTSSGVASRTCGSANER